ncbi:hypothetical protein RAS2_36120 [Phycisphaerae bacterium RAS2]|nr:hypothetical protein RAS2_36120 [Phycisphaerae bacterium RAS2]
MRTLVVASFVLIVSCSSIWAQPTTRSAGVSHPAPLIEPLLISGKIAEAVSLAEKALAADQANDDLRFQLGVAQLLRGVEQLTQSLYKHGLRDHGGYFSFLSLPIPSNPKPEVLSYTELRRIIASFQASLIKAEATLRPIRGDAVRLPLRPGLIRMDFNSDGHAEEGETFWRIFASYAGLNLTTADAEGFLICFDRADVAWFRGYCHLIAAMCDILLAHDFQDLFERVGCLFFTKTATPHQIVSEVAYSRQPFAWDDIADAIAFFHLLNLRVAEPTRMRSALDHLEAMVRLSRETWELVYKEKDDDHEWLPNPISGQTSVVAGISLGAEQLRTWNRFLDHVSDLLAGKALLPHWRLPAGQGINLRRVFTEPRTFDAILWMQGTGATPYVEKGNVLGIEVWRQMDRAFKGGFFMHAVWFN